MKKKENNRFNNFTSFMNYIIFGFISLCIFSCTNNTNKEVDIIKNKNQTPALFTLPPIPSKINFCNENNITRIHFLKLDIGGHEIAALNGAKKMIENKNIDFIQFEFGNGSLQASTTFCDFWDAFHNSYNFYLILNNGLLPVDRYGLDWENYHTANFLLELKTSFLSQ